MSAKSTRTHVYPVEKQVDKMVSDPTSPAKGTVCFCTYCLAHLSQKTAVMGFVIPTPDHGDIQINLCLRHLQDAITELTDSLAQVRPNSVSKLILPGVIGPKARN